jgi:apolipoprotein N-acyltransferase
VPDRVVTVALADAPYRPSVRGTLGVSALMLLWIVAFLPDPLWWGVVPGFVGVLWLVERCRTTRSFLAWSLLFGAVGIGFGYRWLSPTVQLFGGLPAPAAWGVTALFGIVGVAHGWVFALLLRGMHTRGVRPHPLTVVALWVACESLVPRLFPWMAGHGMVEVAPLRQLAEWGGVPLVSFATLCLVAPLHELLRWLDPIPGRPAARPLAALLTFGVGVALGTAGAVRYGEVRTEERETTERLAVGIVQPNIGSLDKRAAEERRGQAARGSAEAYAEGSRKAARLGADLIVWPETAVTESIGYTNEAPAVVSAHLRRAGLEVIDELGLDHDFLFGAYEKKPVDVGLTHDGPPPDERWNTAVLRRRGGANATWSSFRKVYLIPFGETMPLGLPKSMLPQRFTMVPGDPPQALLELRRLRLLPFLCYEGILPEYVREAAGDVRPDVLVSLANDSWFGDTWEPWQHLNFTRFRAVEHRAPLVRATNTGVSAFVSAAGDVEARLVVGADDVLVRDVPLVGGPRTLYARVGHLLPWLLAGLGVLAYVRTRLPRREA